MSNPAEIIFEVTEAVEGGHDARALGCSIFTQGEDWADLKAMARNAAACHFGEDSSIKVVRLHLVQGRSSCRMKLPRDLSGQRLAKLLHRRPF